MTRMLIALACAALISSCSTTPTPSPAAFAGNWSYAEQCGWQHMANLQLVEDSDGIRGTWDDGDGRRGRGQAGLMEGRISGQKLEARFCTEAPDGLPDECPAFREWSDYFVLHDGALQWYRGWGSNGHRLYITLERAESMPLEAPFVACPEDID
ncbi:hypothetical protein [Lysobacter sp. A3-1-A15]|uniref:hypothetical protein n=1 Tax=Novilysobacter viscosus TaxID=3098602 RepID=UPI002EDA7386